MCLGMEEFEEEYEYWNSAWHGSWDQDCWSWWCLSACSNCRLPGSHFHVLVVPGAGTGLFLPCLGSFCKRRAETYSKIVFFFALRTKATGEGWRSSPFPHVDPQMWIEDDQKIEQDARAGHGEQRPRQAVPAELWFVIKIWPWTETQIEFGMLTSTCCSHSPQHSRNHCEQVGSEEPRSGS